MVYIRCQKPGFFKKPAFSILTSGFRNAIFTCYYFVISTASIPFMDKNYSCSTYSNKSLRIARNVSNYLHTLQTKNTF